MAILQPLSREILYIPLQRAVNSAPKRHFAKASVLLADTSTVPRVASSSFWHSLIPKAFRRPDDPVSVAERQRAKAAKSKAWNPATFFIAMAILIGSNAIQSIALRNERLKFTRRTDAKIALLRETIERVRSGEDVDVEKVLGTGEPAKEQAWEEGSFAWTPLPPSLLIDMFVYSYERD